MGVIASDLFPDARFGVGELAWAPAQRVQQEVP